MKLMLIIIANEDANSVSKVLLNEKYFVTKLSTTGGLLRNGSTTLLVGTEDDRVDRALEIIKTHSKKREMSVPMSAPGNISLFGTAQAHVSVGGATVFIVDVEKYLRF